MTSRSPPPRSTPSTPVPLPAAGISVHSSGTLDRPWVAHLQTDPNGNTTTYSYDEAGHLAVTVAPTVNTESNGGSPGAGPSDHHDRL